MNNPVDQPKVSELLPCPGCERSVNEPHDTDGDGLYFVDCAHCGWRGPRAYNLTDAFNRWNRRAAQPQATTVGVKASNLEWTYMPSYGEIDWHQLTQAVSEAMVADRNWALPSLDTSVGAPHIGHQMVPPINFNSLNRIVTAFIRSALIGIPGAEKGALPAGFVRIDVVTANQIINDTLAAAAARVDAFVIEEQPGDVKTVLARKMAAAILALNHNPPKPLATAPKSNAFNRHIQF